MSSMFRSSLLLALVAIVAGGRISGDSRSAALLQTWDKALGGSDSKGKDTPVTRVVNLLKEMQGTLQKEMDEDEGLYKKLKCWCNDNSYEKGTATSDSEAKIADLGSSIEALTAKSANLATSIKEVDAEVVSDKAALAEAIALRKKQGDEFHGMELDSIQALENLKAAILLLGKHHGEGAFAQSSLRASSMTAADTAVVQGAYKRAQALLKAGNGESYYPSYNAQSGEIVGVLKQMEEEMQGDLSQSQKQETMRAGAFEELRNAKSAEIASGEKMSEQKEDELATTNNNLAEAKEDLGQEQASLSESQKFLVNLKKTCSEADKNFDQRKAARLDEIKAVAETVEILTDDEARDSMSSTYNFMQIFSQRSAEMKGSKQRRAAAAALRKAAKKANSPVLSVLATSVELDAFGKVKKAIDDMIATLKIQQEDEVKKSDWCKAEIQENDMTTARTADRKADLTAKIGELSSTIKTLQTSIDEAKARIANLQVNLQRFNEDRKQENHDFQKTVEDQTSVIAVLKKALERLSNYYDSAEFVQKAQQTPPVPQKEYSPSKGAGGVVSMIEKLIFEAKDLRKDAVSAEQEAQAAYENNVADTNGSVLALQKEVATKNGDKARASKDKLRTESDLADTETELEGLIKEEAELHGECDYVLKNFPVRQEARAAEIEGLQQAKQILSGAMN